MYAEDLLFFKNHGYLKLPKVLQIEITNRCPLSCPQCYKDVHNPKDIDVDVLKRAVDEAADLGVKRIMINGGEPLVYPQFIEVVSFINSKNILPTCFTSGAGMTPAMAQSLQELNIELLLSFNGSNKEIHQQSRDGFDITLEAAYILQRYHVEFGINWVARHDNARDLPAMIQFAKSLGAKNITIVCNKINGNYEVESPLDAEDFEYIAKIVRLPENEKYLVIQNCNNILATYSYNMPKSRLYGCPAGIMSCTITVNGLFAPCPHLYYTEKFDSIKEYWQNSVYLNTLRNTPTEKIEFCNTCKRNDRCRFCRAISSISHKDFTKGYKGCPIYKN